jgi:anti-anti-sigma regulatory factor
MNEHDRTTATTPEELAVLESGAAPGPLKRPALVVDLSGCEDLDAMTLSLLLTAQQHAQEEDRDVWLAGVPFHIWRKLHELGLGGYFRPFPVSEGMGF